jgi:hypothetical protein
MFGHGFLRFLRQDGITQQIAAVFGKITRYVRGSSGNTDVHQFNAVAWESAERPLG